jgi:hypothetical protein
MVEKTWFKKAYTGLPLRFCLSIARQELVMLMLESGRREQGRRGEGVERGAEVGNPCKSSCSKAIAVINVCMEGSS